jgi:RNA polymerase-binding transcription factor DksA
MQASTQTHATGLSEDSLRRLRALLVIESEAQAAQLVEHAAAVRQLRDLTDADSVLERELAEAGETRAREAIAEIEHALARIEEGGYGRCEACGIALPFERLEAVPSARFCVRCPGRRAGWR